MAYTLAICRTKRRDLSSPFFSFYLIASNEAMEADENLNPEEPCKTLACPTRRALTLMPRASVSGGKLL